MVEEAPAVAASVPAMEVERGPLVNMTGDQRAEFRKTGNLPDSSQKQEESATSSVAEVKPVGESETPKPQEKPKVEPKKSQTAAERIAELRATIAKIEKGAGIESPAESKTAAPKTETKPEPVALTRPRPTTEDKTEDGKLKYETYEDFVEDLSDWKAEQREAKNKAEQFQKAQADQFKSKMEEASSRYENFEVAKTSFAEAIGSIKMNPVVQDMLNDSDVFPDLVAVIGGSKEELASFVKMAESSPGKAIRYLALTESLIAQELEGKAQAETQTAVEEIPVKPITRAPKPPTEAGGRASTPLDAEVSAVKSGDFRAAKAEFNRKYLASLKS